MDDEPTAHIVWMHPELMPAFVKWIESHNLTVNQYPEDLQTYKEIPEYFIGVHMPGKGEING